MLRLYTAGDLATLAGPMAIAFERDTGIRAEFLTGVFSELYAREAREARAHNVTVDLSLEASKPKFNKFLAPTSGYFPVFSNPLAPTFKPGSDPGATGLVVLMSTTATTAADAPAQSAAVVRFKSCRWRRPRSQRQRFPMWIRLPRPLDWGLTRSVPQSIRI